MLEGLVGRHLEEHGGDAERSLAAVAAPPALVTGLRHPGDPDVEDGSTTRPSARTGPCS